MKSLKYRFRDKQRNIFPFNKIIPTTGEGWLIYTKSGWPVGNVVHSLSNIINNTQLILKEISDETT